MSKFWADVREKEGCICQECGQRYKVDFILTDALWRNVSEGNNLLCGKCIVEALERLGFGGYRVFDVADLRKQAERSQIEMRILWDILKQNEGMEKQALVLVAALAPPNQEEYYGVEKIGTEFEEPDDGKWIDNDIGVVADDTD